MESFKKIDLYNYILSLQKNQLSSVVKNQNIDVEEPDREINLLYNILLQIRNMSDDKIEEMHKTYNLNKEDIVIY